jgi:hypothetical protein
MIFFSSADILFEMGCGYVKQIRVFDRLDTCVILQRSREQTYYDNETVIDTTAIRDQDLVRPFRN